MQLLRFINILLQALKPFSEKSLAGLLKPFGREKDNIMQHALLSVLWLMVVAVEVVIVDFTDMMAKRSLA
ncbi:hypothetical protein [Larkinella soli]|uniref:hypothetical protein n=1 Tax=Larkinella soli TaxID=1770527 RepID=UPI000FFC071F|nr:hypothetical protein [Larkinella soli]